MRLPQNMAVRLPLARRWPLAAVPVPVNIALLLFAIAPTAAQEEGLRLWTDKSGKNRVEAELQSAASSSVTLKRKDGAVVEVQVSQLSDADVEFLRSSFPELYELSAKSFTTAVALENAARRRRFAKDALKMYDDFLADTAVAGAEKVQAKTKRATWMSLADENMQRVGTSWMPPARYAELIRNETKLLEKADDMLSGANLETVKKLLKDAIKVNPTGIRANFRLGLLEALHPEGHSAENAKRFFSACKRCITDYLQDLTESERRDLVACYNNLALTCVRQGQIAEALSHWETCIKNNASNAGVLHNLLHLKAEAIRNDGPAVSISRSEDIRLNRLCDLVQAADAAHDPRRGWRFLSLVAMERFNPNGNPNGRGIRDGYDDPWCMACDGLSTIKCPGFRCDRGTILKVNTQQVMGSNGVPRTIQTPYRDPCPTCNGKGRIDCRFCRNGIDARFGR